MKALKKCIAFVLAAGLILSAMTVFAEGEDNDSSVTGKYSGGEYKVLEGIKNFLGAEPKADELSTGDYWYDASIQEFRIWTGSGWKFTPSSKYANSSSDSDTPSSTSTASPEDIAAIQERAGTEALQHAASDEGFVEIADMYRAAEKGMSAGEYYNNAVVSTPGIENAITVGQGGNLIVNGKVTNMGATISKVTNRAYVDSVRIEQEGTVLNVVDVQYPAVEATINFYTPGVVGDMEIVALQYNAGTWVEVEVAEVREDHIVLNMKGNGVVAFIAK